jgi:hypothetical protein
MKWKLFMCGMVLIVTGCSSIQNQYSNFDERGFAFDYLPAPIPGRTPVQLAGDNLAPIGAAFTGSDALGDIAPYYAGK